MRYLLSLCAVALFAVGCGNNVVSSGSSGSTGGSGSTGTSSGGSSGSSGTTGAVQPRPNYPASDGTISVGHVISNFTFSGYLTATAGTRIDAATTWQDFDLQKVRNLVDANGHPYKYMLLDLSAGWCGPCNAEAESYGLNADATDGAKIGQWLGQGGLFITVLVQNYSEATPAPPVKADIDQWVGDHNVQSTAAGDTQGHLATAIQQSAFPANLIINLDTMQIVDAWYANQPDKTGEFETLLTQ